MIITKLSKILKELEMKSFAFNPSYF